jgi:hypothetical protein
MLSISNAAADRLCISKFDAIDYGLPTTVFSSWTIAVSQSRIVQDLSSSTAVSGETEGLCLCLRGLARNVGIVLDYVPLALVIYLGVTFLSLLSDAENEEVMAEEGMGASWKGLENWMMWKGSRYVYYIYIVYLAALAPHFTLHTHTYTQQEKRRDE